MQSLSTKQRDRVIELEKINFYIVEITETKKKGYWQPVQAVDVSGVMDKIGNAKRAMDVKKLMRGLC